MAKKQGNSKSGQPVERTVQGTETRVDEVTGRVLGPNDETVREAQPDVEPAPNGESFTENAVGREGSQDKRADNQAGTTETVDVTSADVSTDTGTEITEGMSAEEVNPGSVTSASVSKPNTHVTATGAFNGSVTVPQGSTIIQVLSSLGIQDVSNYTVTGPDGVLDYSDTVDGDLEVTVNRK